MRRITYYAEYPIYEPAEGGYYYAGNKPVESKKLSKRACRKMFEEIWEKCKRENEFLGFVDGADWNGIITVNHVYPWVRVSDHKIVKRSKYIGEGVSYVIERYYGSEERGYEPYC